MKQFAVKKWWMLVVLMQAGCSGTSSRMLFENDPPWLTASYVNTTINEKVSQSASIGMKRSDFEREIRRRGVQDWKRVPSYYAETIAVGEDPHQQPFTYIGEEDRVPYGDENYAVFQQNRIAITVPTYRPKPQKKFGCVFYVSAILGVVTVGFSDNVIVDINYEFLPGTREHAGSLNAWQSH